MKIKKIILTGTHHSGKSTLIKKYKDNPDINIMDEMIRALATQANFHFTPDKPINYAFSELALIHFYYGMAKGLDLLQDNKLWLFDRCILDPLYYINYFNTDLPLKEGTLYSQAMYLTTDLIHKGYFNDALILLLKPIEIKEHDGFRLDAGAQAGVYVKAKEILNSLGVKYYEVSSEKADNIIDYSIADYGNLSDIIVESIINGTKEERYEYNGNVSSYLKFDGRCYPDQPTSCRDKSKEELLSLNKGFKYATFHNLRTKGSKLSSCVNETVTSYKDYLIQHDRRMTLITSDWGDLIDRDDQLAFLSDPTSAYALNAAYALGRKKDQRIIEAALGSAYSGAKGETKIILPASQIIPVDYSEAEKVEVGLTVEKLRMARQLLDDSDVDDGEEQYCVVSAKQISDLLKTVEVTSEDYNTVKALVEGKINTFMGFTFKRISSNLLPKKEANRNIVCFAKSGILMATNGDIKTDISTRLDKRMATQVYASLSCGATRMDEKKVVSILCKED